MKKTTSDLNTVQKFYILGHLTEDPAKLAKELEISVSTVKKFLNDNLIAETAVSPTIASHPADSLLERQTMSGKTRGVTIMTGGASAAGDEARKMFKSGPDTNDPSYVRKCKRN